ncbi:AP-5 complex subunit sigma-1 isoform X3 [Syngnathoides biaculeatus]|uniref:AP-5 complex subunit sigma-1 isoform X3 n=1 Tax=Syngnathoides biaculeatus TaxID=300417 RepID=UPI002ADE1AA4|nr:AP-5 complex subunit sigma-1 isoform X3 [Syngnathoides biaculeatus]
MVLAFVIHTVCPIGALSSGECRVLYSRVFGADEALFRGEQQQQQQRLDAGERRLLAAEKIAVVARQVQSAVSLRREASGRPPGETPPGEEALALQEADGGVLRLRDGDPFWREVLLKGSRVDVLLSRLLPHGQLLFLNHRFAQSLEKDVAANVNK